MPRFVIQHRHEADDCGVVFAAFRGFTSPLRHTPALASCPCGGHEIWWSVTAGSDWAWPSCAPGSGPGWPCAGSARRAAVTDQLRAGAATFTHLE